MTERVPAARVALAGITPARLLLARSGGSLTTDEVLALELAHAEARTAVHRHLDVAELRAALTAAGWPSIALASAAPDRATYVQRPDLGATLAPSATAQLSLAGRRHDIVFVVADGLSPAAVQTQAVALLVAIRPALASLELCVGPVVVVEQGRVAVGDEIGTRLEATVVVVLIGERPGLSSTGSMGIYVTYAPTAGCTDERRNCISNISPTGLDPQAGADALLRLLGRVVRQRASGVALLDGGPRLEAPTRFSTIPRTSSKERFRES